MGKNAYRSVKPVLLCFLLSVCIVCCSLKVSAATYQWDMTADGWKLQISESGDYIAAQWVFLDGKWYYFDAVGAMQTGWQQVNEKWYYLWPNGTMATGWVFLDGDWYYLGVDGVMAVNTITPDGYKVGVNGIWCSTKRLSTSGGSSSSGGHSGSGGSSKHPDKEEPSNQDKNEPDRTEPDIEIPDLDPSVPDDKPIASDSNADLEQYLKDGLLIEENDQAMIDDFMCAAIAKKHRTVILVSNASYPYSQKLNRMEYKEIQKFGLIRKQIIVEDKIYYITIYQLEYADIHENVVKECQAPGCQSWGYTISKCNECGEVIDKVYLPPTGHDDTDSDLFCDSCGVLTDYGIDSKQKVRTSLTKPYDTLEFTCIDDNYSGGMLFLSDTVIPYQAGVWFDGTSNNYTWSDARNWLNLNFYNGLSVAKYIRPIDLPGIEDNLPDKVFCLSKDEILSYAEWSMSPWSELDSRFYWSRTAESSGYAYAVHYTGHIASEVIDSTVSGIRPAYVIPKPKNETTPSPIWLKGAKQLRWNNDEEHIFICANPDYRSASGKRGALFYTDTCMPTAEAAAQWAVKMENQHGILAFEAYTDEEGIHPGFLAEQK